MALHANDLPALSVRRPYLAAVLNLLIIIAGVSAIFGVEVRELPDIDRPIVTVRANYPGAAPETIDAEVTSLIEGAVARVNGIRAVRSSSEEDNFRVRVEFNPDVNLIDAANDVREAVSRVQRQLPSGVKDIVVIKADADASPILRLSVSSTSIPIEDLSKIVKDQIVPRLTAINGVADVTRWGERKRILRVIIDPLKLSGYQLSIADVSAVLQRARYDVPAGSFKSGDQEVIVRADASAITTEAIRNLIIRGKVRISDIADVAFGPNDHVSYVRLNGRPVINLGIVRQAKSNTVTIAKNVAGVVADLNRRSRDIQIQITNDDSVFIEGAIREVLISLGLAVLIVIAVIALFIGRFRAALIPAAAIPVALIGTVAAIWLMGFSINLVTLLALVLATGLVVDDAIVVLENIQRLKGEGIAPRAAAVLGTRQVFFAVIATTVTLICVFLPISFLPSTAGRLFREFGFVLAVTVAISSFVALTVCPMLAARLPEGQNKSTALAWLERLGGNLRNGYARLLDLTLATPWITLALCSFVVVAAAIVYPKLGEELVPKEDRGVITVWLVGPDGTGIDYADRQVEQVENALKPYVDQGLVRHVFTITGRYDPNRGFIEAPLVPWSQRIVSQGQIEAKLRRPLRAIPGARASTRGGNSLGLRGAGGGLKFAILGNNYDAIYAATQKFVAAMETKIPELSNFRIEFRATQPQLALKIDRRRASDLGVTMTDLAATVKALVDRDEIAELTADDQLIPIYLQARHGAVNDPSDLRNLYVRGSEGRMVPLAQLVKFEERGVPAELDRHRQRRAIEIDVETADGFSLRQAVDAVRALAQTELPAGMGLHFLGQAQTLEESSADLKATFVIALLIVFLVLVAQFEGLTSAAVVLLTVPFGVCAAIFALALTGTTINIYSQIGILMLIGIMAKNSILMVEFADQLRVEGRDVAAATREASVIRLRPIIMTMASTILAGLPLILGGGPGAEARAAIGWVVFGGLGLAAVFTLFLTPVIYSLLAPLSNPSNAATERLDRELKAADGLDTKG
ncbi:MAG TPA: efflux RND transporter permease subunit [Hyphomicrobiaceae bacterium]|nr:efflux RND transporter permease subunit [Hyphomicrobiaceae bacterium]